MGSINWSTILPLLQIILGAVGPSLKAAALTELKALDAAQTNVLLKLLIEECEKMVAAA